MPFAISSCGSDLSTKSDSERTSRDDASHAPGGGVPLQLVPSRAQRDADRAELLAGRRRKQRRRHEGARDRKRHLIGVRDVELQIEGDRHGGGRRRRPERLLADERTRPERRRDQLRAVIRRQQPRRRRAGQRGAHERHRRRRDGGGALVEPRQAELRAGNRGGGERERRQDRAQGGSCLHCGVVRAEFIAECASRRAAAWRWGATARQHHAVTTNDPRSDAGSVTPSH